MNLSGVWFGRLAVAASDIFLMHLTVILADHLGYGVAVGMPVLACYYISIFHLRSAVLCLTDYVSYCVALETSVSVFRRRQLVWPRKGCMFTAETSHDPFYLCSHLRFAKFDHGQRCLFIGISMQNCFTEKHLLGTNKTRNGLIRIIKADQSTGEKWVTVLEFSEAEKASHKNTHLSQCIW